MDLLCTLWNQSALEKHLLPLPLVLMPYGDANLFFPDYTYKERNYISKNDEKQ